MTAVSPQPFTITGFASQDGNKLNKLFGYPVVASENGITATPSGTQINSYLITAPVTRVTTVTTTADGVSLPPSLAGQVYIVINSGANSMTVFGNGTDTIGGTAGSTGVAQAAAAVTMYICPVQGSWFTK